MAEARRNRAEPLSPTKIKEAIASGKDQILSDGASLSLKIRGGSALWVYKFRDGISFGLRQPRQLSPWHEPDGGAQRAQRLRREAVRRAHPAPGPRRDQLCRSAERTPPSTGIEAHAVRRHRRELYRIDGSFGRMEGQEPRAGISSRLDNWRISQALGSRDHAHKARPNCEPAGATRSPTPTSFGAGLSASSIMR